jgi:hypothetical protein
MPLPGASVLISDTSGGTTTDIDGTFTLKNVPASGQLTISFVGYQSQTIAVAPQINITLKPDQTELETIVVTGYSSQKGRHNRCGSCSRYERGQ